MNAYSLVRQLPVYRCEAFESGLRQCGFRVSRDHPGAIGPGDLVLTWNRYGGNHALATRAEAAGAVVMVCENAFLGRDWKNGHWYSLALNHHNGAGDWRPGGPERWDSWGEQLAPWREDGRHILVLPQRGIGPPNIAMPTGWSDRTVAALRKRTSRPVVVREHPGEGKAAPLSEALAGAWCAVTWGSGAALKALQAGIPVFHEMPQWIGAPAALPLSADLERPFLGDRLPMFRRLAWAMWSTSELSEGTPFRRLLNAV